MMKKSGVSSRLEKRIVVTEDGEVGGELSGIVDSVIIGEFIKFMMSTEGDQSLKCFGSSFLVFYHFLRHVNWETGHLPTHPEIKKDVSDRTGIGLQMIDKHITNYIEFNLVKRLGTSLLMINPLKVFMGDKAQQRKVAFSYNDKGWRGGNEKV